MEQMTQMTRLMMDRAKDPMSITDAVKMLEEGAKFRSFSDKLNAFAYGRDIRKVLTNGLVENHPEAKYDAIDKKVRNWLNGRTQSVSKQDAFELCFVMGLNLEDSERFISMVTEEGIHWRDASEIVLAYALMNGKTYSEAQELLSRVPEDVLSAGGGNAADYGRGVARAGKRHCGTAKPEDAAGARRVLCARKSREGRKGRVQQAHSLHGIGGRIPRCAGVGDRLHAVLGPGGESAGVGAARRGGCVQGGVHIGA